PVDKFLDYALWLTARELESYWLPEFQKGRLDFGGNTRRLVFSLEAVKSPAAVKPLVDLVKAGKVPAERVESVLTLVAALGGPKELEMVFDLATDAKAPAGRRAKLLAALELAGQQRQVMPEGDLARIGSLLN